MDGKPFQIKAGELHPARIPHEYWKHRIQMVKAMGCNTISLYVFWNFHEQKKGSFDFKTGAKDLGGFIDLCRNEGMLVMVRPGPYVCAEWDFGGLPSYLLASPETKVRCSDPIYLESVSRYIKAISKVFKPRLAPNGGPIIMLQIENEYGSYGNDRDYLFWLKKMWIDAGINVPFYTADGPTTYMLEAGSLPGCAVGMDSGTNQGDWDLAKKMNPGVPALSSETYPGWLTHWGEKWAKSSTDGISKEVQWFMDNNKSFGLYVAHGGTNFGWSAGANSGGKGYEPDVTSYDYDAPITEQGRPTEKYLALRSIIGQGKAPKIPDPIPAMSVPPFALKPWTSLWESLPEPIHLAQPKTFESLGQDHGFQVYRTRLIGHKSGRLDVHDIHDFATVFVDGKFIGTLDRREGKMSIDLPQSSSATPILEILVEGMGRINFAQTMHDRKGITDRVTLNGMTLMNWECFKLPMDENWVLNLSSSRISRPGNFFRGNFDLDYVADTFLDMSEFRKGVVWVNGHNLGRYWEIGPQKRLFCPAPWLKKGKNSVVVFDLLKLDGGQVAGFETLE